MNLFQRLLFKAKTPKSEAVWIEPKVGDIFVDRIWGDTKIQIVRVSEPFMGKSELVRYKYLTIKGNPPKDFAFPETSVKNLYYNYKPATRSETQSS